MKLIWKRIELTSWRATTKMNAFLWTLGALFGAVGLLAWSIVRMWTLNTLDWLVCFIGYPVMLSWLIALLYTYNHDFHDGKPNAD